MKRVPLPSFRKFLALALTAAFLALLIPVLAAARYNLPDSDDLIYGQGEFDPADPSVSGLLQSCVSTLQIQYAIAHGRYAASFFGALILHLSGINGYWFLLFFVLAVLVSCTLFCTKALFTGLLKTDRWTWLALSMTVLICWVQLLPSAGEGLFWFSGAIAYTLPYSLTMLLAGLLLRMYEGGCKKGRTALLCVCAVLTAAVAAGLGYAVLIVTAGLLLGNVVLALVRRRKDCLIAGCVVLLTYLAGCAVQLTAPGIAVRATYESGITQTPDALSAVLRSFVYAAGSAVFFLDVGTLLFLALTAVLLFPFLRASGLRFRMPLLSALLAFCLYATLFTFCLYSLDSLGPDRMRNVYYFGAFWFWGVSAVCAEGWLIRKWDARGALSPLCAAYAAFAKFARRCRAAVLCALLLLFASAMLSRDTHRATAVNALLELRSGTAAARYEQRLKRIESGRGMDGTREGNSYIYYY